MKQYDLALYGLGVMGSSLAKNFLSRGYSVALFSKSEEERARFHGEGNYEIFDSEQSLLSALKSPRIVFLMITAGWPVDQVSDSLLPYLDKGDVIVDGGNSYYQDTADRCARLEKQGICFVGAGISGGEKGALTGPSMMVGGSREGWEKCGSLLRSIAARRGEVCCCDYVGREGAGHYVKMVHNGIEYAILQLIADVCQLMSEGLGMNREEMREVFEGWRGSRLDSYLLEITIAILGKKDEDGQPLVDKILDVAGQKGTGSWTLQEAIRQGVYIPTICEAVFARYFSGSRELRLEGSRKLTADVRPVKLPKEQIPKLLGDALLMGMIESYAQGIELIHTASENFGWEINLPAAVSLWQEGCIIRSTLLKSIRTALEGDTYRNLLLTEEFAYVSKLEPACRKAAGEAMASGLAVPALTSAVTYYDSCRTARSSVYMVQALRDCFGAHTYQRTDREGNFHTQWEQG
jgi:6-phosphogluconate dehydrogenase